MNQATTKILTDMALIQALGLANQLREACWVRLHTNYGPVRWPDYTPGGVDMFRVYRLDDPTIGIEVDRLCGWSEFVSALEEACYDGSCGIGHSADLAEWEPLTQSERDVQEQANRLLDWIRDLKPDDDGS